MRHSVLLATFDHEDDLLEAARRVRGRGFNILDAYTPYPVHGLDEAMGLRPSRLTWVCFAFGMAGALGMLWFQNWTAAVNWQLDVGGKPWNSLPSDVPVAFEAAVLLAGFATVFAFFGVSRLFPGKQARVFNKRITDDRFVLAVEEAPALHLAELRQLLDGLPVVEVEIDDETGALR